MDFILILGPVFPTRDEISSKDAFDLEMRFLDRASKSGFDGVALNHHYVVGPEAQCFQPLPLAAYILAKHPNLYVMTTIFVLPYHNPVEIAEQLATIDLMSPGKFIFGVGQGYRKAEANAVGIGPGTRAGRMTEAIEAMRLLWKDGPASYNGKHFKFENIDIGPRPVNPNGPPIVVAADKLHTIARIPSLGPDIHWLPSARHSRTFLREAVPVYKEALAEAGREFIGFPMQRAISVAKDEKTAAALVEKSYPRQLHIQHSWGQPGERYDLPFDELRRDRMILGNPQAVAEELIDIHKTHGVECFVFHQYTPGMDPERSLDMIEQVGSEVLPIVRRETSQSKSLFANR